MRRHGELQKKVTLDDVFSPRSVAIVGVSATRMGFAESVLTALINAGFPYIYPVNPKYKNIKGLLCYASLMDIPGPVDHVIVNIPARLALTLLDECAAKGVRSVHFFTAGFSESGEATNARLEQEMLEKARAGNFRIIGPNCVGLFVTKSRLSNSVGIPLDSGPVSFISQSGGHADNFLKYSHPRGVRFNKVVSYGNALDVTENELLEYLSDDNETEIIGAYIEGVKDGKRFSEVIQKVTAKKPLVIYKGGQTEAGQRAALGHTASMTSSVDIFKALCRQYNVIQAGNLEELVDIVVSLRFLRPLPKGRRVAMVGAGGGPSVQAGDELEAGGLHMPGFSSRVQADLKKVLPVAGGIFTNPLDTSNMTTPDAVKSAFEVLGRYDDFDMFVYHLGFHPIGDWGSGRFSAPAYVSQITQTLRQATEVMAKPIILALRPPHNIEGMKEFLAVEKSFVEAGLPVFYAMDRLAKAVSRVITWKNRQDTMRQIG